MNVEKKANNDYNKIQIKLIRIIQKSQVIQHKDTTAMEWGEFLAVQLDKFQI